MASGTPLTDDDRTPWLQKLNEYLKGALDRNSAVQSCDDNSVRIVLACSALKRKYRSALTDGMNRMLIRFVLLDGSEQLIFSRLQERANHFMRPEMLVSQLAILEKPNIINDKKIRENIMTQQRDADDGALLEDDFIVNIDQDPLDIIKSIKSYYFLC
jgi:carbohydrate kinase (thermoresistant glucokinase family)